MSQSHSNPETENTHHSTSTPTTRLFILRMILAILWVVAICIATARRDFGAILMVGIPVALIGFAFIAGHRWGKITIGFLIGCATIGIFFCYCWPYLICPIELPPSAHKLYATDQGFWIAAHIEVRFNATVEDCIETAERVQERFANEIGNDIHPPVEIDRKRGKIPPQDIIGQRRKWWLNTNYIQKGLYYPGGGAWAPEMWIDTERGIFYLRVTD